MRRFLFLILALILIFPQLSSTAQSDVLTARETMRIGRGTLRHVEWHPDDDLILVDTANGAWLYDDDLNDVAHLPDIRLARFSPDGQYISGVNAADELLIYDARTRYLLHRFAEHDHHIRELHWQGNRLATYDGYQLVLWEDLEVTAVIDWRFLEMITWNPSGTMLVAKQLHGKLLVATLDGNRWGFNAPGRDTLSLQWKDDFTILHTFLTSTIQPATLINASTGNIIQQVYNGSNSDYAIHNDWLAVARYNDVTLNHLKVGHYQTFNVNSGLPHHITWRPDGEWLVFSIFYYFNYAPNGPLVYIINLNDDSIVCVHDIGSSRIQHLVWQPDGEHLLTVDVEQRIHIWNIESAQEEASTFSHSLSNDIYSLSPSGQIVAIADTLNGFSVWENNEMSYQKSPYLSPIEVIRWQPHGTLLATVSKMDSLETGQMESIQIDPRIMIWDGVSGNSIDVFTSSGPAQDIKWSPNGTILSIASFPDISFWDGNLETIPGGQLGLGTFLEHRTLNWSPDSKFVSFVHSPGSVTVENLFVSGQWNELISSVMISSSHGNIDSSMGWHGSEWRQVIWERHPYFGDLYLPSGPFVKVIYPSESERILLKLPGEPLEELTYYQRMAFSPDATIIIGETDGDILRVWHADSRAYLYWTEGYAFAFSPNSQYLAVLTDTHVNILDARTGEILLGIDEARFPQDEYELQWSDDGTHLAIGGEGMVSVWEIKPE